MLRPAFALMSRFSFAGTSLLAFMVLAGCQDLTLPNLRTLPQATPAQPQRPPAAAQAPASVTLPLPPQGLPLPPPPAVVAPPPVVAAPLPSALPVVRPVVEGPARVAFLVPLSGAAAALGQAMLDAAHLALFDLGNDAIVLIPRDTQGTPEGAAAAARAVLAEGAELIVGPLTSAEATAVSGPARLAQVNVLAFSSDRSIAGNGVFALGITPQAQVERIVAYAQNRGMAPIAALVPNTVYGNTVVETLRQTALRLAPGMLGPVERYDSVDSNLSPVVRRLANYESRRAELTALRRALEGTTDPTTREALRQLDGTDTIGEVGFKSILLPEGGDRLLSIAPLLAFYDIDPARVKLLGTSQWDDPRLGREPVLVGGWFAAPAANARAGFERRFKEVFERDAPRLATLAYDAVALAALLARTDESPDFSMSALTDPSGFAGVDGIFRFRLDGTIERGLAVMEIRREGMRIVDPAPETFVVRP